MGGSHSPVRSEERIAVRFNHSPNLADTLERLGVSLAISTYQAGRLVTLGVHEGKPALRFSHFPQVMGVARTPTGLAVAARGQVWTLPASREIAPELRPRGHHDVAFLTRTAHLTGSVMAHELAWGEGCLWLVNTLFDCLCTLEAPHSFTPRWQPPFIGELGPGDRCHLNGLAMAENEGGPIYVTALGESEEENGWRENKRQGGCLIDVATNRVVLRGLSMPHSPRLYRGRLWLLDSGRGALCHFEPSTGELHTVVRLPGFTRGLDFFAGHAFVGLSRIRETAVFGGLEVAENPEGLRCGVAIVDLSTGQPVAQLSFESGVEEIFSVCVLPGFRNPIVIGPTTAVDETECPWLVPPLQPLHRSG